MASELRRSFYQLFRENMQALGIFPVPEDLFGSAETAALTITGLATAIEKYGSKITLRELLALGPWWTLQMRGVTAVSASSAALESLTVIGGLYASAYLGACIGSLAVASGEYVKDRINPSSNGTYSLDVADRVCGRFGIPFSTCLTDPQNRPQAGGRVDWARIFGAVGAW